MIRQKMDSLSFELLSRMAHMMTRMTRKTHWLDSHVLMHDSLARWLAGSQFVKTRGDNTAEKMLGEVC